MLGSGSAFMHEIILRPAVAFGRLEGMVPLTLACLLMVAVRATATVFTVGSGQSAGFLAPVGMMGFLIGTAVAVMFGFSDTAGMLHTLQAAGFAGLLASALNVPLAAAVMASEIFGPTLGFPAAFSAILGFQVNRHHTVYDVDTKDSTVPVLSASGSDERRSQLPG